MSYGYIELLAVFVAGCLASVHVRVGACGVFVGAPRVFAVLQGGDGLEWARVSEPSYDVGVRVKDDNGDWSNAVIRRIQKFSQDIIAETEAEIKDQVTQPDKGIKKAWTISVLPDQVKETHLIKIGAKTIQVVRDSDENDVQFLNKINYGEFFSI